MNAALSGFKILSEKMGEVFKDPLVNEAITTTTLAGITGSASGGLNIILAAMGEKCVNMAVEADIPMEVMHRIASMASGGMDTLPHDGAVISLL